MTALLSLEPHPLLDAAAFVTQLPAPLGELDPAPLAGWLAEPPPPGLERDDALRGQVRALLRHGGFRPSGRSKPASEYLVAAVERDALSSINLVVDACNAVSFHSGLPISVVDLDLALAPLSVRIAPPGASYVFNASGQTIDIGGLLALADADGPCANAVKDAQRTKTSATTTRTLSIVWGTVEAPGRAARVAAWYRALLESSGATTHDVALGACRA